MVVQMAQAMQRENHSLQYLFYALAAWLSGANGFPSYHYDSPLRRGHPIFFSARCRSACRWLDTGVYRERPDIDLIRSAGPL